MARCLEPGCPVRFSDGEDRWCVGHARELHTAELAGWTAGAPTQGGPDGDGPGHVRPLEAPHGSSWPSAASGASRQQRRR